MADTLAVQPRWLSVPELVECGLRLEYSVTDQRHRWKLFDGVIELSTLSVLRMADDEPWEIGYVETHCGWRRMGLAAALYDHAVSQLGPIQHDVTRTVEGDSWARAVGGALPDLILIG